MVNYSTSSLIDGSYIATIQFPTIGKTSKKKPQQVSAKDPETLRNEIRCVVREYTTELLTKFLNSKKHQVEVNPRLQTKEALESLEMLSAFIQSLKGNPHYWSIIATRIVPEMKHLAGTPKSKFYDYDQSLIQYLNSMAALVKPMQHNS
jgi:hypothetical protein